MTNCAPVDDVGAPEPFLGGRLRLFQRRGGHRAGTDAVLLAAAASADPGRLVADLGAGSGAVGLAVAARAPDARVVLAELDEDAASLAERNAALNGMQVRVQVVRVDLLAGTRTREEAGLPRQTADLVLTNPPYLVAGGGRSSPDEARRRAHEMGAGGLDAWIKACAGTLRRDGVLALIHRADALGVILAALEGRFGAIRLLPVLPRTDASAHRLLVQAVKGSRSPLQIRPALVLHEANGAFTPRAIELHHGEQLIDWDRYP